MNKKKLDYQPSREPPSQDRHQSRGETRNPVESGHSDLSTQAEISCDLKRVCIFL